MLREKSSMPQQDTVFQGIVMNQFVDHQLLRSTTPNSTFSVDELLDRIEALGPVLKANAQSTEVQRQVSPETIALIRATGMFDLLKPKAFGGQENTFENFVKANITMAKYCASTAWVCGLLGAHQWLVACFSEQAQNDVWQSNPEALVCGSYAPITKAIVDGEGYRVSGRWSFASGCDRADWALCAAIIPSATDSSIAAPAFMLVPKGDYTIFDSWNVVGLAGTGSKTLVLENVFIPKHRLLSFAQSTSGDTPGAAVYQDIASYRIPMLTMIPSCLASVAVGAAAGALENYIDATGARVTRGAVAGAHQPMAEFATIQLRVADAAASVDAAKEILLRDLRDITAKVHAGEKITQDERIKSRRGQSFASNLALRAVEALNASTGGQGLTLDNPVQRAWRDVNAVCRHISMNWDTVGTMVGQQALGLPPKGQY
jgi:resorcinol 4-hydroxylase (FADH2)